MLLYYIWLILTWQKWYNLLLWVAKNANQTTLLLCFVISVSNRHDTCRSSTLLCEHFIFKLVIGVGENLTYLFAKRKLPKTVPYFIGPTSIYTGIWAQNFKRKRCVLICVHLRWHTVSKWMRIVYMYTVQLSKCKLTFRSMQIHNVEGGGVKAKENVFNQLIEQ